MDDGACEAMTEYIASIAKCWYNKVMRDPKPAYTVYTATVVQQWSWSGGFIVGSAGRRRQAF